jgi:hypothetical protein
MSYTQYIRSKIGHDLLIVVGAGVFSASNRKPEYDCGCRSKYIPCQNHLTKSPTLCILQA